jgi:hypothetical protein
MDHYTVLHFDPNRQQKLELKPILFDAPWIQKKTTFPVIIVVGAKICSFKKRVDRILFKVRATQIASKIYTQIAPNRFLNVY